MHAHHFCAPSFTRFCKLGTLTALRNSIAMFGNNSVLLSHHCRFSAPLALFAMLFLNKRNLLSSPGSWWQFLQTSIGSNVSANSFSYCSLVSTFTYTSVLPSHHPLSLAPSGIVIGTHISLSYRTIIDSDYSRTRLSCHSPFSPSVSFPGPSFFPCTSFLLSALILARPAILGSGASAMNLWLCFGMYSTNRRTNRQSSSSRLFNEQLAIIVTSCVAPSASSWPFDRRRTHCAMHLCIDSYRSSQLNREMSTSVSISEDRSHIAHAEVTISIRASDRRHRGYYRTMGPIWLSVWITHRHVYQKMGNTILISYSISQLTLIEDTMPYHATENHVYHVGYLLLYRAL